MVISPVPTVPDNTSASLEICDGVSCCIGLFDISCGGELNANPAPSAIVVASFFMG